MPPETKKYLFDILEACALIRQFSSGKSFTDYENDPMLRSAVERQFGIIGEALSRAVKIEPSLTGRIRDVRRIINFRNVLIHGYAVISNHVVWGIIENDLERLTQEVDALYRE